MVYSLSARHWQVSCCNNILICSNVVIQWYSLHSHCIPDFCHCWGIIICVTKVIILIFLKQFSRVVVVTSSHEAAAMWIASRRVIGEATAPLSMNLMSLNSILALYLALKLRIMPWSHGWRQLVAFGGRNSHRTDIKPGTRGWAEQLSTNRRTFRFCFWNWLSSFITHSVKISDTVQAFLLAL